jgi:toxin-antitoxin system PIN domain toxin
VRFLIDSNVLIAASMKEVPDHSSAHDFIISVLSDEFPWCLSWINVYEFLRVTTHRRVFPKPLNFEKAFRQIQILISHPACEILQETSRHVKILSEIARIARPVTGNFVHDCHIAAMLFEHDVHAIVTYDTHFRRFGAPLEVWSPQDAMRKLSGKM